MTDNIRIGRVHEDWHLAQHITKPRPAWHELGLKRTRGDTVQVEDELDTQPIPPLYRYTYRTKNDTWCVDFVHDGQRHYVGTFKTQDEAARNYNDYVAQHGMARELLAVGDDTLEAAS